MFTGYYVVLPAYGQIYDRFMDTSEYSGYSTQEECEDNGGVWENGECQPLKDRAMGIINLSRKIWLIAPIIFALGLIFWLITISLKEDPQDYYLR